MNYHFGYRLGRRKGGHYLTRDNYIDVSIKNSSNYKYDQYFLNNNNKYIIPRKWLIWYVKEIIIFSEDNEINAKYFYYDLVYLKQILEKLKKEHKFKQKFNRTKIWKNSHSKKTFNDFIKSEQDNFFELLAKIDFKKDITGKTYSDSWIDKYKKKALQNFDLNLEYFESLSTNKFNQEIENFLAKYEQFKKAINLNHYSNKSGYYLMVVDKYKQLYLGTSKNIGKRIRNHWNKKKELDRLLFPPNDVAKSIISFDSCRALDITRIYIYETKDIFSLEDSFIDYFNPDFIGNRMSGGIKRNLLEALAGTKTRELTNKNKDC